MPSPVAIKVSADFADSVRAAEAILPAQVAAALKACAGDLNAIEDPAMRRSVLEALDVFRTKSPDDIRKLIGLDKRPAFEPDPANPDGLIRVNADGTRTHGTVKGRTFVPAAS